MIDIIHNGFDFYESTKSTFLSISSYCTTDFCCFFLFVTSFLLS